MPSNTGTNVRILTAREAWQCGLHCQQSLFTAEKSQAEYLIRPESFVQSSFYLFGIVVLTVVTAVAADWVEGCV